MSAARALARKGLVCEWRTGRFGLTEAARRMEPNAKDETRSANAKAGASGGQTNENH